MSERQERPRKSDIKGYIDDRTRERVELVRLATLAGPERVPTVRGLEWTGVFDLKTRGQFLDEMLRATAAWHEREDHARHSVFNGIWRGWRESAEIMSDPARMARLMAPLGRKRGRLQRPGR